MADGNNQLVGGNNDDGGDDIFVYTGGDQEVPRDVKRAKIDESVDTILAGAFAECGQLIEVVGHKKLKKIEAEAFYKCRRLRRLAKMNGVKEIEENAFYSCTALSDLEFDKLEIIAAGAFFNCTSLGSINLLSVRRVGEDAFHGCGALTDAVFGEELGRIEGRAFFGCPALRRIVIPLKDGFIVEEYAFFGCHNLSRVDIVGGIHKTISSLHMESWKNEIDDEINRINRILPEIPHQRYSNNNKTKAIQRWIRSVIDRMEHYKTEHKVLVKEAMALLELALWKAKLLNEEGMQCEADEEKKPKKAKIDKEESIRAEHRVTCGANIVIKNVLPFLALKK